jgi:hypothetical protein
VLDQVRGGQGLEVGLAAVAHPNRGQYLVELEVKVIAETLAIEVGVLGEYLAIHMTYVKGTVILVIDNARRVHVMVSVFPLIRLAFARINSILLSFPLG